VSSVTNRMFSQTLLDDSSRVRPKPYEPLWSKRVIIWRILPRRGEKGVLSVRYVRGADVADRGPSPSF